MNNIIFRHRERSEAIQPSSFVQKKTGLLHSRCSFAMTCLLLLVLAACGVKRDLKLPDKQQEAVSSKAHTDSNSQK